jgi:hypothetical protein
MPSFDNLLRRITPRHSVPAVPASPAAMPVPPIAEPQVEPEEPGYFRQALIDARVRWAKDVQRAAQQRVERVVFTDQYVPPPPRRPSGASNEIGWFD